MISYDPFWNTLKKKGISTYKLIYTHKVSTGTLDRIRKGKPMSTTTLNDFCRILDCRVEEILQYEKED